ncbi:MAG: hypothetical protein IPM70_07780 [Proteobacteria bacterium]|nr:hypothetical protein [Pseudomonadota bacterium]
MWASEEEGIALAHRRLSIIDLSTAGAQPMLSHCGRYVIAYNGEIFNFPELRLRVESARSAMNWRGHSDTEVLLEAIVQFGVGPAVSMCNGMFALALWDRRERLLTLARDRLGKKSHCITASWGGTWFSLRRFGPCVDILLGASHRIGRQFAPSSAWDMCRSPCPHLKASRSWSQDRL